MNFILSYVSFTECTDLRICFIQFVIRVCHILVKLFYFYCLGKYIYIFIPIVKRTSCLFMCDIFQLIQEIVVYSNILLCRSFLKINITSQIDLMFPGVMSYFRLKSLILPFKVLFLFQQSLVLINSLFSCTNDISGTECRS